MFGDGRTRTGCTDQDDETMVKLLGMIHLRCDLVQPRLLAIPLLSTLVAV